VNREYGLEKNKYYFIVLECFLFVSKSLLDTLQEEKDAEIIERS
jgi:hypothetical protein